MILKQLDPSPSRASPLGLLTQVALSGTTGLNVKYDEKQRTAFVNEIRTFSFKAFGTNNIVDLFTIFT